MTLAELQALDRTDPLAPKRAEFLLPEGVIYLDGNSLGALPKRVVARMEQVVQAEWGQSLIKSWNLHGWIDLPQRVGARIARLIGAEPDEVIAADSTSVNLFKVLLAALELRPGRRVIVSDIDNFPTDLYIAQGIAELRGGYELRLVKKDQLEDALDEQTAVLLLTEVDYRTGYLYDMARLTGLAQQKGALTIWDLAHSAGASGAAQPARGGFCRGLRLQVPQRRPGRTGFSVRGPATPGGYPAFPDRLDGAPGSLRFCTRVPARPGYPAPDGGDARRALDERAGGGARGLRGRGHGAGAAKVATAYRPLHRADGAAGRPLWLPARHTA